MIEILSPAEILAFGENRCVNCAPEIVTPEIAFWQCEQMAIVIGLSQEPEQEIFLTKMAAAQVELFRRHSGGGAVLIAPGILGFEIFTPLICDENIPTIRESFAFFLQPIIAGLEKICGRTITINGVSDLTVVDDHTGEAKKICGTAQMRKRAAILTHGTILVDFDLTQLNHYLRFPSVAPTYRGKRTHSDFCTTLNMITQKKNPLELVATSIAREAEKLNWRIIKLKNENRATQKLLVEKYQNSEWNYYRRRNGP